MNGRNPYALSDGYLEQMLGDDVPCGDATTFALGIGDEPGELWFRARYDMVVCGSEEAARMSALLGLTSIELQAASGSRIGAGEGILKLAGKAALLHQVWKVAQTLMEYLSGIATSAAEIVAAARRGSPATAVTCTRKNFPGTKAASIKAILSGGASPHRLNISDSLLLFQEHRVFMPRLQPTEAVARLRAQWPERTVVVELADEAEARVWLGSGVEILQLDKLSPEAIGRVRRVLPPETGIRLAAAGGVNAANAEAYARAGADILVTSAPYLAPPRDVAVVMRRVPPGGR